MRTFVAVAVPERIRDAVAAATDDLRRCGARVRWVNSDSLHFTLKFLGEVDAEELEAVDGALRRAARQASPTEVRVGGLGAFPNLRRPRVIWAGVEAEDPELERLHARIEGGLAELGFPPEDRAFRPHVTLGRVKSSRGLRPLTEAIEENANLDFGKFQVREMVLYESRLGPTGARYTPLSAYPFGESSGS